MIGNRHPRSLVPTQRDFADAHTALTTNRSTGRVNVGRGERIPYWAVGESYRQDALRYLRQYASPEGRIPALLVREPNNQHDANAVAIVIYGYQVGYLKRDDAADMADMLDELAEDGQFLVVPGCFQGGTTEKPSLGIVVEVREPSDRLL